MVGGHFHALARGWPLLFNWGVILVNPLANRRTNLFASITVLLTAIGCVAW